MTSRSEAGFGTLLRRLVELLDGDLEAVYKAEGLDYRPRYTPVMKALADGSARTIKEIASLSSASHSAASQTISLMASQGLVIIRTGDDQRERWMSLTPKGRALLPVLTDHWRATSVAVSQLEAEIGFPLVSAVQAAVHALEAKSFRDRIGEKATRLPQHTD